MLPPDPDFEARQDAELRAVPMPAGLLSRLRQIAVADDEGLDEALRRVPVPEGLTDRLQRSLLADDEALDEAVRDVRVPVSVQQRLRRIPKNWLRLTRLTQWATAASLLIAIGLSYVGAMVALLWATYPPGDASGPRLSSAAVEPWDPAGQPLESVATTVSPGVGEPQGWVPGPPSTSPQFELTRFDDLGRPLSPTWQPLYPWTEADPLLDATAYRWGILGAHALFHEEPEWQKAPPFVLRGTRTPMVPGYPREFETKYGVHAFVSPGSHSELVNSVVPLNVDTSSYELTRRYLEDGKLPPRGWLRTEEFLAAVDYGFPQPEKQTMGLHAAAAPAPFQTGVVLLQFGVQAKELPRVDRSPAHLTLAVDTSASMRRDGRLAMIRRALGKLVGQMGPEDRISLVTFSEYAQIVVENIGPDEAEHLMAGIATLRPQSSTNVPAGLSLAYAVAERTANGRKASNSIVLLSDGLAELDRGTYDRIEQHLAEAADQGLALHVIDLAPEEGSGWSDSQWSSLSLTWMGGVHRAESADQIGWVLKEIATGQSQLLATEARLQVSFNPKVVMAYRLLGHEAGVQDAPPEADFHSGQSATALYEVQLKPAASGEIATAELAWSDPDGSQYHRANRKIHSKELPTSLNEAALSLQAAAVVSETAKVLRHSPFTPEWPKPGSLARVLKMTAQLDPRLMQRPTFVEFISMVEQAEKAKP